MLYICSYICMYVYVGDKRPAPKDYQQFLTKYCLEWRSIGLQLGLEQDVLDVINADHLNQRKECFGLTLDKWLQLDTEATWSKLELAITNANRATLSIAPLDTSNAHI